MDKKPQQGQDWGRWLAFGSLASIGGAILLIVVLVGIGLWVAYSLLSQPSTGKGDLGDGLGVILVIILVALVVGVLSILVLGAGGILGLVLGILGITTSREKKQARVDPVAGTCPPGGTLESLPEAALAGPRAPARSRNTSWGFGLAVAGTVVSVLMLGCGGLVLWLISPLFDYVHVVPRPRSEAEIRAELLASTPLGSSFDEVSARVRGAGGYGGVVTSTPPGKLAGNIVVRGFGAQQLNGRTTNVTWRFDMQGRLKDIEVLRHP